MPETWDEIVGKRVLVGMTYLDNGGDLIEQKQRHGVIVRADAEGVYVRAVDSDAEFWLPPHLESFREADGGDYHLRDTGETVSDPDFVATFTIRPGPGT